MYIHVYMCVCVLGVLVSLIPEGTEEDNWSLGMSCKTCISLKHQCKYSYKITLSIKEKYFPLILDVSESLRNRSLIMSTTELPRASYHSTVQCRIEEARFHFMVLP